MNAADERASVTRLASPHTGDRHETTVAEAPASLECRHYTTLEVSSSRRLAIGEIVQIHIRGGLWNHEKMRIDMTQYHPLARLFGNFYAALGEPFTHVRQSYEEWAAGQKK